MSRVADSVHIVTTDGTGGLAGATATAVTSISDAPPSLLVCLNQSSQTLRRILANKVFSVNLLSHTQEPLARRFSGETGLQGEARFQEADGWMIGEGAPYLPTALANFRCILAQVTEVGSHAILVGTVQDIRIGAEAKPLLYHQRRYGSA